ncbi:MAG: DUF2250 domain-containing protein [Thermodesulfobacteria bacterium]|nr:DUF2250 domain-containing protein [Thermodesulfobacteriota bacterium]
MVSSIRQWKELDPKEQEALLDIRKNGPDCAKFLSRRIKMDLGETMKLLSNLEKAGWLKRVQGTFLFKRGFKKPKHMNHTYYELTRNGEKELRFLARKGII